ncbi:uncharacterized protein LOC127942806 isoform X2 [Carassius gibelio]|uniref:uncharacterized protein LOC127942806 isoform X2 n=1 Tax=Carassius gibelio TaxID=101364 RepID=UPI002278C809|nr:uncharacterized protein LOC127942806 isoform X2 [Carassius gibelio]
MKMFHRFWFCLCFWRLVGVFGEIKYVKIGQSVTLNSGLSETMDNDLIQWRFENRLIAEINVTADRFSLYDDVHDGRFRDRLKLDKQTGSLTITNFTFEHAGDYSVYNNTVSKRFWLSVYDEISVKEGDSVTLNSDRTEIDYYWIRWSFEDSLIAKINKWDDGFSLYDDVLDGRFRDRLKLDNQTGSLTITNITTEHAGRYELVIDHRMRSRMRKTFFLSAVNEEISVKKGDSVTLNSDLTEIMNNVSIKWRFGAEITLLAEISRLTNGFSVYDDVLDGRFRDRLKLDNQTGSLTITDITFEHAGRYLLHLGPTHLNLNQSLKAFSVSVSDSVHCCGSTEAVIRLVLSALVGVATVILLVYDIRSRRAEQDQTQIHTSGIEI